MTGEAQADEIPSGLILHAGCGADPLPEWLSHFKEVRLDIDPRCGPHIQACMTDMGEIGPFDAAYCSHALEHLPPYGVAKALGEFKRVLRPGGALIVIVPDLEDVRPTAEVVYESAAGPVTGLDMFYGLASALEEYPHMAHRTGFVAEALAGALAKAGFADVKASRLNNFNLLGTGTRP